MTGWVPLLDPKANRILLVEMPSSKIPVHPGMQAVTGMVRSMDSDLQEKLQDEEVSRLIETRCVLVAGEHPGHPLDALKGVIFSGGLLALFIATFAMRYVVFQRTGRRLDRPGETLAFPETGIDLRFTGSMKLEFKGSRRFLNVPASLATLDTGQLALVSRIDASSFFMGIRAINRSGVWASVIQAGMLKDVELGLLYLGFGTRPALRLDYVDATTGQRELSILSFRTERERQVVIQDLDRFAGRSTTATVVR